VPEDVVREIDGGLDNPNSEVSRLCRQYSRVVRLMFGREYPSHAPDGEPEAGGDEYLAGALS
jgi:hypothetical protein